jgi:hypothetical protein
MSEQENLIITTRKGANGTMHCTLSRKTLSVPNRLFFSVFVWHTLWGVSTHFRKGDLKLYSSQENVVVIEVR